MQKFLRHKTLQTTLGYVHAIPDEVANEKMFAALFMAGQARGESMTRMKPLGGALTILVAVLAGCGGGGGNEAEERISACTTEVSSSVLEGIGLSGEPNAKLLSAAEAYCRDAEAEGALEDEEIARERTGALISDHASRLFTPICDRLAGRVREAMPAEALRYLTDAGFQGYGKGVCAVAGDYVRDDASRDLNSLFSEHTELMTPFCAAAISASFASDPGSSPVPAARLDEFGQTLCTRLLQEDLIVAGERPGEFSFNRTSPKYQRIVREVVDEYSR